jgi:hypothetical protein
VFSWFESDQLEWERQCRFSHEIASAAKKAAAEPAAGWSDFEFEPVGFHRVGKGRSKSANHQCAAWGHAAYKLKIDVPL